MFRRLSVLGVVTLLLLAILAPRTLAQSGTPAATACAPAPSGPAGDAQVRQQVILDEMKAHLQLSLSLWKLINHSLAAVHASHPSGELMAVLSGDLKRVCLLDALTAALTRYTALSSQEGDVAAVSQAQADALALIDQADVALIPADARADLVFNFRVMDALLEDAHTEYTEGYQDGKIDPAKLVEYQDAVGFYQVALAHYQAIQPAVVKQYPDLDKTLADYWTTFASAYPGVLPPDQPVDPATVDSAVDGWATTVEKALNVSLKVPSTPLESVNRAYADLVEAADLYAAGKTDEAYEEAASAYLDQFENAEAALSVKDKELMETLEQQMKDFRDAIKAGKSIDEVKTLLAAIQKNIEKATALLNE